MEENNIVKIDYFLREKKPGCACDLITVENPTFNNVTSRLQNHVCNLLEKIEQTRNLLIQEFVIGKSFVEKNMSYKLFRINHERTWDISDGVGKRWKGEYKKRNFDGLIVVAVVTSETLPHRERLIPPFREKQTYAIALEQNLIHYFAYVKQDPRLSNKSLHPGRLGSEQKEAYVVYVAFRLKSRRNSFSEEISDDEEGYRAE